jgi:hypothetical protein
LARIQLDRRPVTPFRVAVFVSVAVFTGLIVGGPGYALIAGVGAAMGLLIALGIRRVS